MYICMECHTEVDLKDAVAVQDAFGILLLHPGCVQNHNNDLLDTHNRDVKFNELLKRNKLVK